MNIYRVDLDAHTYKIIEADYFDVTRDELGNRDACFYVKKPVEKPDEHERAEFHRAPNGDMYRSSGWTVHQPVVITNAIGVYTGTDLMIGYFRNPAAIQFDDRYEVKPHPGLHLVDKPQHQFPAPVWPHQITNCRSFGSDDYDLDTSA